MTVNWEDPVSPIFYWFIVVSNCVLNVHLNIVNSYQRALTSIKFNAMRDQGHDDFFIRVLK